MQHIAFVDSPKQEFGLWGEKPPVMTSRIPAVLSTWEQRIVNVEWGNRRTARHYKILPHRYLPGADIWIWVDANVRLRTHPISFVKRHLSHGLALMKHPDRQCLYKEALFCAKIGKDKRARLTTQTKRYRQDDMPANWGLGCTKVVIRRNTAQMHALGDQWWSEVERHSFRDQVSLPYTCWKLGIQWDVIPGMCDGRHKHDELWYTRHTKHG